MALKEDLGKLSESLKQYRDELRLQLHLAKQDVRDEWDDLEVYWEGFRQKVDELRHDAEDASRETREAAHKLGDDLKRGYDRIRERLK